MSRTYHFVDHIFLKTIIPILYQHLYRQIEKINEKHATFSIESLWSAKHWCQGLYNYAQSFRIMHLHPGVHQMWQPVVHRMSTTHRPLHAHIQWSTGCVHPVDHPSRISRCSCMWHLVVHPVHPVDHWMCRSPVLYTQKVTLR